MSSADLQPSVEDPARWSASVRAHFPSLERLAYLNSGSYGLLADRVEAAVREYLDLRLRVGADWNAWILGVAIVVFSAIAVSLPQAWEEVINILLGIWMVISSWVIGVTSRAVETNFVIVGLLVILFAAWAMAMNRNWQRRTPIAE